MIQFKVIWWTAKNINQSTNNNLCWVWLALNIIIVNALHSYRLHNHDIISLHIMIPNEILALLPNRVSGWILSTTVAPAVMRNTHIMVWKSEMRAWFHPSPNCRFMQPISDCGNRWLQRLTRPLDFISSHSIWADMFFTEHICNASSAVI